jgi:exodeoxyribonuclease V alpha subunit
MKSWLQRQDSNGCGILERLFQINALDAIDYYMALFLMEEVDLPSQDLALAIALTTRATREGHVCLDLSKIADGELLLATEAFVKTPPLDEWRTELMRSGVVGEPGAWQPLVLDSSSRLYLHRYWDYEHRLGCSLLGRAADRPASMEIQVLAEGLKQLFHAPEGETTDWQSIAAATAILSNLTVISGGPGTGKTSTVVRILALLRQIPGGGNLRIGLAAPTGMAAARLQQSIRHSKKCLPLSQERLDAIPDEASTLHRLLGVLQQGTGFRHHQGNPLLLDVLILDEASMVDVALMSKVLEALPKQARLILLGDRDQLASVEAGSVLGDICTGCEGPSPAFAERLARITEQPVASMTQPSNRLSDSVVLLQHSYRFSSTSPIGRLAKMINQGDAEGAVTLIHSDRVDLSWLPEERLTVDLGASHFAKLSEQIANGCSVEALFETLNSFRILAALREGPSGVIQLNQAITHRLKAMGLVPENKTWYVGRPVMLTRNDYQLNLYNGETGIVLPHPDNPTQLSIAFIGSDGAIRWVSPTRLAYCETVYALTVHKSQGSEFQQVLLHLPRHDTPLLCRELIYTAVTRSREQFRLVGPESTFTTAVKRSMQRNSGLADRLSHRVEGQAV